MDFDFLGHARRSRLTFFTLVVSGVVFGSLIGVIIFFLLNQPKNISWSLTMTRPNLQTNAVSLERPASSSLVEEAFAAAQPYSISKGSRIILIPHHLVAAREIASVLSSIQKPKRIILLAPDHLGVGRTSISVGNEAIALSGGGGRIDSDQRIASNILSGVSQARGDETAISRELSMGALLPFLSRAFPKASITPVLMKVGDDEEARDSLVQEITNILASDSDAVLVSTVDFSHYLPDFAADFHDVFADDVLHGLADRESDRVELDSAGVLAVTLATARSLGLGNVQIHAHTNSIRILQSTLSQESTSHFIVSFSPGDIQPQRTVSMLFLGDMMFDREVKNRMSRSKTEYYPFDRIAGQEQRMFRGQDAVIANLEGPVTPNYGAPEKENDFAFDPSVVGLLKRVGISVVSQANNHTLDQGRAGADMSHALLEEGGLTWVGDQVKQDAKISLRHFLSRGRDVAIIALNEVGISIDKELVASTLAQASTSTYRVVYMHWGNEYQSNPTDAQTELAHWLIDHGADAVIGSHPHWMEGIEVYKNKPIAYSLGNFIFDQDWSVETQYGLMTGLVLNPSGFELHLFPIRIDKSDPILLTGDDRQSRLDRLAEISDPSLKEQIEKGVVRELKIENRI